MATLLLLWPHRVADALAERMRRRFLHGQAPYVLRGLLVGIGHSPLARRLRIRVHTLPVLQGWVYADCGVARGELAAAAVARAGPGGRGRDRDRPHGGRV